VAPLFLQRRVSAASAERSWNDQKRMWRMRTNKFFCYALLLLLSLLAIPLASSAEDSIPLMEYTYYEVADGYFLNVNEVDTYSNTVGISVTYGSNVLLNQFYSPGNHFSYKDGKVSIDFDIDSLYTDAYYLDYVVISNIEVSTGGNTGSIAVSTSPPGVEVYLDDYYMGTNRFGLFLDI
jgi:hypothetical protein